MNLVSFVIQESPTIAPSMSPITLSPTVSSMLLDNGVDDLFSSRTHSLG